MSDESTSPHLNTIKSISIIYNKLNLEEKRYFKELLFGDPLAKIYFRVTLAYLLIMGGALLWPFDFALIEGNNAQWIRDPAGISFPDDGQLISDGPARSLFEHMQQGRGSSIEVWMETERIGQTGPARIISYSSNTLSRNFTLGQSFDQLIFRLRTTETDLNGTQPHLVVNNVFVGKEPLHIVVTYNFSEQLVFINGELREKARFLKGDFSNWDPNHKLVIGNEASGGRPWRGKIYYAAIYNRPLDGREVRENYQLGLTGQKPKAALDSHAFVGISARYLFDEAKGDRVFNRVNSTKPLPLTRPDFIRKKDKSFLSFPNRFLSRSRYIDHFIMNVMIFIPLGFLVHATFRNRYGNTVWISVISAAAGIFFTLTVETLQYFSLTRDSSSFDISANSLGMMAGVLCDRFYAYYLQRRAKNFNLHY